jgi:hypothetical protein
MLKITPKGREELVRAKMAPNLLRGLELALCVEQEKGDQATVDDLRDKLYVDILSDWEDQCEYSSGSLEDIVEQNERCAYEEADDIIWHLVLEECLEEVASSDI